ncbi:uncharacterized protein LOC122855606 [Aphidius gifuensis]|uniref:uncharacterized protein LOC122855606 n=1 Tax=Aphidius gifuensis TaxID=684658 RepID=UPI001CDB7013|nr:uncharacterized protein LOC122855606 [Aphidius gifuensis]
METTKHMATVSKQLVEQKGLLSLPEPKKGKKISESTKRLVLDFYNDERNSSTMPGKKDFLSIRDESGKRTHVQKKLVLSNLNELFRSFQAEYPTIKIEFSTFAAMRPRYCILAGASGTHTVCVCSIHQNIKLMILGCNLKELTKDSTLQIESYEDCINAVICSESTDACHLGNCLNCPKMDVLNDYLDKLLEDNEIFQISYKQWVAKPRTTLETVMQDSFDFIRDFCEKTENLLRHAFIARCQGNFLKTLKESINDDEAIVICDFAENYAFIIQDAAPGFHWNNNQATVYTVVIYFKDYHKSLAIVSDNSHHDAIAVHIYTRITIDYIKSLNSRIKKIHYFSDGAPQQFKNYKNVVTLCHHKKNYGIEAEWHFFATAHGKGPCDGVGGTLKREAARASLQRPTDKQITTPKELYDWANEANRLPNIAVKYSSAETYELEKIAIEESFTKVQKIKNLQKVHCLIPCENDEKEFAELQEAVKKGRLIMACNGVDNRDIIFDDGYVINNDDFAEE